MKGTIVTLCCLVCASMAQAQTNTVITPGTQVVMNATMNLGAAAL